MHTHTHARTRVCTRCRCAFIQARARSRIRTHIHTLHTHTHALSHSLSPPLSLSLSLTHTHTHTHTHTVLSLSLSLSLYLSYSRTQTHTPKQSVCVTTTRPSQQSEGHENTHTLPFRRVLCLTAKEPFVLTLVSRRVSYVQVSVFNDSLSSFSMTGRLLLVQGSFSMTGRLLAQGSKQGRQRRPRTVRTFCVVLSRSCSALARLPLYQRVRFIGLSSLLKICKPHRLRVTVVPQK